MSQRTHSVFRRPLKSMTRIYLTASNLSIFLNLCFSGLLQFKKSGRTLHIGETWLSGFLLHINANWK